jgi:hypothetical protein
MTVEELEQFLKKVKDKKALISIGYHSDRSINNDETYYINAMELKNFASQTVVKLTGDFSDIPY